MRDTGRNSGKRVMGLMLAAVIACAGFMIAPAAGAQPQPANTWAKIFAQDATTSALLGQSDDGGFLFSGATSASGAGGWDFWLLKMDGQGGVDWEKTSGTSEDDVGAFLPTPDGGALASGVTGDLSQPLFWMAKLDPSSALEWQEEIGTTPGHGQVSAVFPQEGGYLLAGTVINPLFLSHTPALVQLDSSGRINWQWNYKSASSPGAGGDVFVFTQVVPLKDGTCYVSGTRLSASSLDSDLFIMCVDSTGAVVWQEALGGTDDEFPVSLLPDDDGVLLQGLIYPFGQSDGGSILLIRLDDRGNVVWMRLLSAEGGLVGTAMTDPSGGYLLSGTTQAFGAGGQDVWAMGLGGDGAVLWQKAYGGPGIETGVILPDALGGYLLSGSSAPDEQSPSDCWVAKLDETGAILWQNFYGGSDEDSGGAARLAEGDLLVYGQTSNAGDPAAPHAWMMRLDETGGIGTPCQWIRSADLSATDGQVTVSDPDLLSAKTDLTPLASAFSVSEFDAAVADGSLAPEELCVAPPTLSATASSDVTSGEVPLKVDFAGSADGGMAPYAYAWDFGDGDTGAGDTASHTFALPGDYTVTLTVTDSLAQAATDAHLVIHVTPPPLVATAAASVLSGTAPFAVAFTGSATGGSEPYACAWDFGDGTTGTGESVNHAFSSPGDYTVTLTVTDSASHTALDNHLTIHVTAPLSAASSADKTKGTTPLAVTFAGSASGGTPPYTYAWNFGDGESADGNSPTHTFSAAGSYFVTLTVTDDTGDTAAAQALSIIAYAPLAVTLTANPASGDAPLPVSFGVVTTGGDGHYSVTVDYGDGQSGMPGHTYTQPGVYSATATATDTASHTATSNAVVITVIAPLEASASASAASGQAPLVVSFSAAAAGGIAPYGYAWTFGDGQSGSGAAPSHTYTAAGDYMVTLTVTDSASHTALDNHLAIHVTAPTSPPVIGLMKKLSPFGIKVTGSNLQSGIKVYINGTEWAGVVWKKTDKIKIIGGKALKTVVPKGVVTTFRFVNPDGGETTATWSW